MIRWLLRKLKKSLLFAQFNRHDLTLMDFHLKYSSTIVVYVTFHFHFINICVSILLFISTTEISENVRLWKHLSEFYTLQHHIEMFWMMRMFKYRQRKKKENIFLQHSRVNVDVTCALMLHNQILFNFFLFRDFETCRAHMERKIERLENVLFFLYHG